MNKSDICARDDGIKVEIVKCEWRTFKVYKVPCRSCGEIMDKKIYASEKQYLCDYCKYKQNQKDTSAIIDKNNDGALILAAREEKKERKVDERTKKERMFDSAINNIKKQVKNIEEYNRAIELAERCAEKYGSIPETMVAIELLRLGHRIIPQQKIKRYRVDFALPDLKLVIEVDGKLFHTDPYKGDREAIIQLSLGLDWKIMHLPAELISKDIRKLKKIIETRTCNTSTKF